jgi:hypothetical protein
MLFAGGGLGEVAPLSVVIASAQAAPVSAIHATTGVGVASGGADTTPGKGVDPEFQSAPNPLFAFAAMALPGAVPVAAEPVVGPRAVGSTGTSSETK